MDTRKHKPEGLLILSTAALIIAILYWWMSLPSATEVQSVPGQLDARAQVASALEGQPHQATIAEKVSVASSLSRSAPAVDQATREAVSAGLR